MGNKLVTRARNVFGKKTKQSLNQTAAAADANNLSSMTSEKTSTTASKVQLEEQIKISTVTTSADSVKVFSENLNHRKTDQLNIGNNEVVDSLGNFSRSNSFCVPDKKMV